MDFDNLFRELEELEAIKEAEEAALAEAEAAAAEAAMEAAMDFGDDFDCNDDDKVIHLAPIYSVNISSIRPLAAIQDRELTSLMKISQCLHSFQFPTICIAEDSNLAGSYIKPAG